MGKTIYDVEDFELERPDLNPNDFKNIFINGSDWTVETIFNLILNEKIDLNPKLQRRDVWNDEKKSKLIESVILGVPVPQIILAEELNNPGHYLVIDGKQRTLSICQFLNSINIGHSLRQLNKSKYNEFSLKDLEILKELNGMSAVEIEKNSNKKKYIDSMLSQTIRTVVIRNWKSDAVLFDIFNRLNMGTEKLSPQELRMSLFPGEFLEYINENSELPSIMKILNIKKPDFRMRDVELIIRCYAFSNFLDNYDGNLQKFLDDTVKLLNYSWEKGNSSSLKKYLNKIESTINSLFEVFEDDTFRSYNKEKERFNRVFNTTSFDLLMYFFTTNDNLMDFSLSSENNKKKVKEMYIKLFDDSKFVEEFASRTTSFNRVKYRFKKFKQIALQDLGIEVNIPEIWENDEV